MDREIVKEQLLATDDEFRKLHQEHQEYEGRLALLTDQLSLSEAAEVEAKRIKVHKLALKDRMESLIRAHAPNGVGVS